METIDDIVREMRVMANVSENGYCVEFCNEFADRIEAAIRGDGTCTCKDCGLRGFQLCEHRKLMDENARLRAALKPVLECDLNSPNIMKSWGAVRDAQRIYNESEVNHEAH